jgi:hypothetical protein
MPVYERGGISERYGQTPAGSEQCGNCSQFKNMHGKTEDGIKVGLCPGHEYVHATAEVCTNFKRAK